MKEILNELKNGDLVITPSIIKTKILKKISKENKIINLRFMTKEEFIKKYFDFYSEENLYTLMKMYNLKYGVAKEILENFIFDLPSLKEYKKKIKLNKANEKFKKSIKRIVVIGYENIDKYLKDIFLKYEVIYKSFPNLNYIPKVYEFDKQTDEIAFVCSNIIEKLKEIPIEKIFLVNVNNDNIFEIKRIFKMYNLPINLDEKSSVYGTETCNIFLKKLRETRCIESSLEITPKNNIYNKIVEVLNKYTFIKECDDYFLEIIKNELSNAKIVNKKLKQAINVISIDDLIYSEDEHYYILDFNQGILPRLYKDDQFIKDSERGKYGLNTSLENLKSEKKHLTKIINNIKNLTITYKNKDKFQTYFKSPLIDELNLEVIKNPEIKLNYSHAYNKILLSSYLDDYINFNVKNKKLEKLYSCYQNIPYQTYSNDFNFKNKDILKKYKNSYSLSYSSINNYFLCAFRFYISSVLKLEPYEEKFSTLVGSLFHYCLSKMYESDFDLKKEYNEFLKDKELNEKEVFFIKKLYFDLSKIIENIKEMENHTSFKNVETEMKIETKVKDNIKFVGIVDKIMSLEKDEKKYVQIIDYKTGNPETSLDNINYGLHLQLPMYIYLIKNKYKNSEVTGFYLQKILSNAKLDLSLESELKNSLKLDGYIINDENIISLFDDTYEKSLLIKSMSKTEKGFSSYAKLVSSNQIEKLYELALDKINEVVTSIENVNFVINPKKIDDKLVGCEFCKFKDLCFKKEEDAINLKTVKFKEIIKEEE